MNLDIVKNWNCFGILFPVKCGLSECVLALVIRLLNLCTVGLSVYVIWR